MTLGLNAATTPLPQGVRTTENGGKLKFQYGVHCESQQCKINVTPQDGQNHEQIYILLFSHAENKLKQKEQRLMS